jgi:hypothetical protein
MRLLAVYLAVLAILIGLAKLATDSVMAIVAMAGAG